MQDTHIEDTQARFLMHFISLF